MKAGRLRHRVTLQASTFSRDDTGAATSSDSNTVTVWAEVRTLDGNETNRPDLNTVTTQTIYRVTIRKPVGTMPVATGKVTWQGRQLEIVAVLEPDNRQRMVQLDCIEVGT